MRRVALRVWIGVVAAALAVLALLLLLHVFPTAATGGPDVIVQSVTIDPSIPDVGQVFTVTIVTKNQGDVGTGNFWNYIYLDPVDEPPNENTPHTYRYNNFPIGPGGTFQYTRSQDESFSFSTTGCEHVIYLWADKTNLISETVETNNVLSQTVCVGVECQPDAYEEDDTCSSARWITNTVGITQHHTLCPVDDEDWVKFSAVAGITYTIEATNLGMHADPLLYLYNTCGGLSQYGTGARIVWRAPASGLYYVQVVHRQETYGPLADYDLTITADSSGVYDPYEPDDTCAAARDIPTDGTRQTHCFQAANDQDWVKFPVHSGETYILLADNTGPGVSPQVSLFSFCGQAFGEPLAQGQQVEFDSGSGGMLYARVVNQNPDIYGPDAFYDLSVTVIVCAADGYEDDDTAAEAREVSTAGVISTHNICPASDQDWIKFDAISQTIYLLETSNLGPNADTELFLYDTDGATELAQNDDYTVGLLNSRIVWQAPASGMYYAMVRHVKADAAGEGTRYDLSISEGACSPDTYEGQEGDNGPFDAAPIATGGSLQSHNFCPMGDQDWVSFEAPVEGITFTIQTSGLGPDCDTVLHLYGRDGATMLALNDDYGLGGGSFITYTAPSAGTYYVRVLHYNSNHFGSGTSYELSVAGEAPPTPTPTPTPPPTPTPTPTPTPFPTDLHTLILVNRERIEVLYGASAASQLIAKLWELAVHPRVQGLVVQVELAPSVAAAYSIWTADDDSLLDTGKANDVASAVRNLVLSYLANNPNVEHILIAGDDRVIPFRRTTDFTGKKEDQYAPSVTISTTQWAACRDGMSLTDNYYADEVPTNWAGGELYLPDYAIGRLIEEPDDIMAFIDAFLAAGGIVGDKALVTGYDFVQDAANLIHTLLTYDSISSDSSLIGYSWNGSELKSKQLHSSPRFDIQSINGHANHTTEKAPDGDDVTATEIATATSDLTGAIIFSVGCHSGFNDSGTLDLAQAFAQKRANYVANTGYGWGGGGVTYSEALMRNYAFELLQEDSMEMGLALTRAKTRYYNQASMFGAYDEKILVESTFYGLPMYIITSGATLEEEFPFPSVEVTPTLPTGSLGELNVGHLECGLAGSFGAFEEVTDTQETFFGEGSFFGLDGSIHAAAGEPIQPKFFADVSAPAVGTLRGVLFLGGVYTDMAGFDPVIVQPINEYVTPTAEPAFEAPGWYPPVPFGLRNRDTVLGSEDTLVTLMGQFNSEAGTERLYEGMAFDTYYSTDLDVQPPNISYLDGILDESLGRGFIKVEADDPSGIVRLLVAHTEGQGEWFSQDLEHDAGTHKWKGEFPATQNTVYFVQVVDGAGNVQVAHNKGRYYPLVPPAPLVEGGEPGRIYLPLIVKNYATS